jgi:hypothetical protein
VTQVTNIIWGDTPFDTIVKRNDDVSISGLGAQEDVPIEMLWLSLVSVDPVSIGGFDFFVHVGLSETTAQTAGRMRLTSESADGREGTTDIGRVGDSDDPSDPDFLGLPVNFQIKLVPVLGGPIVPGGEGMIVLHGACPVGMDECPDLGPSGVYSAVPEPVGLLLLGVGVAGAVIRCRRRRQQGCAP